MMERYTRAVEKIAAALMHPIEVERCKRANEAVAEQVRRGVVTSQVTETPSALRNPDEIYEVKS